MRREYGQQFVEQSRRVTVQANADFPFATPSVADLLASASD
jgi:hypothetical protein